MQILFCDNLLSVRIVYLFKTFLNIIRFIIPIILIIRISINVYKGVISENDDKNEILKNSSNKVIAAIIVFLVPTVISVIISFLGMIDNNATKVETSFLTCYNYVNKEVLIEYIENEKQRINDENEQDRQQSQLYIAANKAYKENIPSINKKNNNSSGTYSSNITDLKRQNHVYIENGTFYYPNDIPSGQNCDGFNPSTNGYNSYFYDMLTKFVNAAKTAGHTIVIPDGGCRSYSTQQSLSSKYSSTPGRAASPGKSKHGWAIACDLQFRGNGCTFGNRTDSSCASMAWAHQHAAEFGLEFNLLNASYKEDWHIQPINIKGYSTKGVNDQVQ